MFIHSRQTRSLLFSYHPQTHESQPNPRCHSSAIGLLRDLKTIPPAFDGSGDSVSSRPTSERPEKTYKGQFGYHNSQYGKKINSERRQVVVCIVRAQQEQHDRYTQQEFLCWGVLISIVDLLPHVQVVVGSSIEFKRYSPHPVEHKVRAGHVCDVCEGPRPILGDAGNDVEENL